MSVKIMEAVFKNVRGKKYSVTLEKDADPNGTLYEVCTFWTDGSEFNRVAVENYPDALSKFERRLGMQLTRGNKFVELIDRNER